jgi:hypothetical protein
MATEDLAGRTAATANNPGAGFAVYTRAMEGPLGRALSRLDNELTSPSRGSFDRTWWCWKFTDFSAARFQEGAYTLAWLATSALAPAHPSRKARLIDGAAAAIRFWSRLQHSDGSFDEAYPFERSLAATAFTGFYVGCAIERLRALLPQADLDHSLVAIEHAARWLAANGEYHGILSNHLAAAAAALQVAGDLLGTDRFVSARDRYLGIIYANQAPGEGWLREYGGADPGYQSHAMFYMAEIWRRTGDAGLLACLTEASRFIAWFAHPDGTLGGEYASRGTKFAYPAAFEILAPQVREASAVATHLRSSIEHDRGVGPHQMDAWNLFPMLNNFLFAAEAAGDLSNAARLPLQQQHAERIFPLAGLLAARRGSRVLAAGLALGGSVKLWDAETGRLLYEDCGFASVDGRCLSSQSASTWQRQESDCGELGFVVDAPFTAMSRVRWDPWRFLGFRTFSLTVGRLGAVARALKRALVAVLINRKRAGAARLRRVIRFEDNGTLHIADHLTGLAGRGATPLERHVPFHMGSARYADRIDWSGADMPCPQADMDGLGNANRTVTISPADHVGERN